MNPTVIKTAKAVRKEVQRWAYKLEDDYAITPDTLRGACGIASFLLHEALEAQGISSIFVMGRFWSRGYSNTPWADSADPLYTNHCWLVVDGMIVDITATQFDEEEPVYLTEADDDRYRPVYQNQEGVDILMSKWDDQSPKKYPNSMPRILTKALQEISQ